MSQHKIHPVVYFNAQNTSCCL